ncbi:MAG: M23 family metallopeptidase [Oscillospiraceae bacterium]|nr:M23 family metallopeptidase [Oscillospiraceae bacterium]
MNNQDKKGRAGRGYYAVLTLCALAIGISGYLFLSAALDSAKPQEQLSVPTTIIQPPAPAQTRPVSTIGAEAEKTGDEAVKEAAEKIIVSPVKGETLMDYSDTELQYNATTKDWRLHTAVDIAAPGQKVMAAMAGTVTDVYDDDFFGATVVIKHDDGYETRYANLTVMPTVKKGDTVKAGDVIGAVGDTAIIESAMEPHLHFQVLKDGNPIDPKEFIK